mgnify:CR=1 FL=1
MFNAHWFVYSLLFTQRGLRHCLSLGKGNARAFKSGMSDETRIPALFYVVLNELFLSAIGSRRNGDTIKSINMKILQKPNATVGQIVKDLEQIVLVEEIVLGHEIVPEVNKLDADMLLHNFIFVLCI